MNDQRKDKFRERTRIYKERMGFKLKRIRIALYYLVLNLSFDEMQMVADKIKEMKKECIDG